MWAFEDFGRIVVHWDHEGLSALHSGDEIASYTVRWRQRGTLTWNTVVQNPVDPDDPDILIGTDLLPEDETYEILLSLSFVGSTPTVVYPADALLVYVDYLTSRQQVESGDVLYMTNQTTDSLYTLDTSDGSSTLVGATGLNIYALSYCEGVLYGATNNKLYTIDRSTAATTRVHPTNTISSLPVWGLACVNNALYAGTHNGSRWVVVSVNEQLGTSAFIAQSLSTAYLGFGLTGHVDGMYSIGTTGLNTSLYSITTSGTNSRASSLSGNAERRYYAPASDNDDTLYTIYRNSGTTYMQLYAITNLGAGYTRTRVGTTNITNGSVPRLAYARIVSIDAPENITVSVAGTSVTLNWDAVTDATGYKVQWRTANGTFGDAFEQIVTTNSATVSGLTASTTFYFQVIATRSGAEDSDPSTEQTVQIGAPLSPPVTVTGLRLSVLGNSITADWDSASNADSYNVQWRTSGGTFGITNQIITTSRTATIEDLAENTPFQVRVIATRVGVLDGTPSSVESATTEETITSPSQVGGGGRLSHGRQHRCQRVCGMG